MKTKEKIKNIYLISIISVGFLGLVIGSTFALFNNITNIENPITFNSNLNKENFLSETIEVAIPVGKNKKVDLVITNDSEEGLYYATWYMSSSNELSIQTNSSNNSYGPVGLMPANSSFILTIQLTNNSEQPITVTLGVSSSVHTIILPSGAKEISS